MKHLNIRVVGVVQGVNYRASARQKAQELGIHGFVRNERDGSVYLEAEGAFQKLEELVAWCKRGPARAVVREVIIEEAPLKNFVGFIIDHSF